MNGSAGAVSVKYVSADGSAVAPSDYAATSGTLSWSDGDASEKSIVLGASDDASAEGTETVRLVLHTPGGGAALGTPAHATVAIGDDDDGVACQLQVDHDVSVAGMMSDRFNWCDSAHRPRVAVLAHNDGQTGPDGVRGGALREYRYEVAGGTRVVPVTVGGNAGQGGFGYIVSHANLDAQGRVIPCSTGVADNSPLGHQFTGQFQRVFEGRHHALFRFTLNYPRYGCATPNTPAQAYQVPVTIDWLFASGRDHPLWAVTYDMSAVPVNAVMADSRSPYGELNFDGTPTGAVHSTVAGVAWGERYKFESTTDPVTYQSGWRWDELNSVPYVKLWTTEVDATMGTVQTQTMSQQDAGGYWGAGSWRRTSADGSACPGAGVTMPCSSNWPFQSINYNLGVPTGTTSVTRLAWGTNFGFLGRSSYPVMGSAASGIGGPVGNGQPQDNPYAFEPTSASGWPRKSYAVFVVLGLHSADPVGAQVAQMEHVQSTTLTATTGSVRTSGPAGANRTDNAPYEPAGWNPVHAAWALAAADNEIDANFEVGEGTLNDPLIVVSNWTAAAYPGTVRLNGVALVQDVDYYPSLRAGSDELWLTLNRNLSGAANRLEMLP